MQVQNPPYPGTTANRFEIIGSILDRNPIVYKKPRLGMNVLHNLQVHPTGTQFLSYNPISYNIALVKTLVHRIYNICNSNDLLHTEITKLKQILARNMYPPPLIDKVIRNFLSKCITPQTENQHSSSTSFYKLPYLRDVSERTKEQLKHIQLTYCKSNNIRISFSTFHCER